MIGAMLKYPGGKSRLMKDVLGAMVPPASERPIVVDPFVGSGGAVLNMDPRGRSFYLSDASQVAVSVLDRVTSAPVTIEQLYQAVPREQWEAPTPEYYAELRGSRGTGTVDPLQAVWLNRAGFNGVHRVNKAGRNNVPFGDGRPVPVEVVLSAAAAAYHWARSADHVSVEHRDVFDVLGDVHACGAADIRQTFLFVDPPYWGKFVGYTAVHFSEDMQRRLACGVAALGAAGCKVMLTNSAESLPFYASMPGLQTGLIGERTSVGAAPATRRVASTLLVTANLTRLS